MEKKYLEKIAMYLTMVASICTISGVSIWGIITYTNSEKKESKYSEEVLSNEDTIENGTVEAIENVPKDEVIESDKNIQKDEGIGEEIQSLGEDDRSDDVHQIVLGNDDLFQNSNTIDWEWGYEGDVDNKRRLLKNTPSEMGIDVSYYQETIDWDKVKADGIDFAIIRIGSRGYKYGNINLDSKFKENMDGAIANGIKTGVYFYSQAINHDEMDEEINEILKAIEGYSLDYPVGIELLCEKDDYRTYELSTKEHQEEYINLIKYFCDRIKQNGYTPMIYGEMEWFQQFPEGSFDGYYKWVFSPGVAPNNIDNCVIWQYERDTKGIVDGITHVSVNLSAYNGENNL